MYVYIYIYTHMLHTYVYTYITPCSYRSVDYGQFSKVQSGEMCPDPGRFELSKGMLK